MICVLSSAISLMWSPGVWIDSMHPLERLVHDRVLLVQVDEAPGHDLGPADDRAGLLVDRHDDHEHAVVGERAPVAQDDVPDVADRQPIDVDVAGGDRTARRAVPSAANSIGVPFSRMNTFSGATPVSIARRPCWTCIRNSPCIGMKCFGLVRPEHQLQLFLAGMTGHVRALDRVVEDVRAGLEQVVDRARDRFLVAGDRAGADDHRVARLDLDESVVAVGHPGEAGHRLALRSGRGDHELGVGMVLDLVLGNDPRRVVGQVAEVGRDAEVLLHRAPDDRHAPVHVGRGVEDLLDARDVAGEGRHDDPAFERLHDLAEGVADRAFRRGVAGVLGARRVGQQAQHALLAEPGEDGEVGQLAIDRRVVELEVAGVDDRPDRRPEGDAHRVRDRVADPERHDVERADVDLVARLHRDERVVVELVLLDLVAEQAARQGARRRPGTPGNSGSTYGSAPTWSSWAWVMRNALTLARRSLR